MSERLPWIDISNTDPSLHAPARIAILLFLLPRSKAKFSTIQKTLDVTPGNLSSHLKKLESSNFIDIEKKFVDDKPTTVVHITSSGLSAITSYAKILNRAISDD
ncbi:MAG: transcriptional regulator [Candidatus Heimdallarchaeota archaeon]|nr:transcriptional regulator [Candidatus Heimdallarchaeota archaeon]